MPVVHTGVIKFISLLMATVIGTEEIIHLISTATTSQGMVSHVRLHQWLYYAYTRWLQW